MAAVETFESLLNVGLQLKDAYAGSGASWRGFLSGPAFKTIEPEIDRHLRRLRPNALHELLHEVQRAQQGFLRGRAIGELSSAELRSYFELLETERLLLTKPLDPAWRGRFLASLLEDMLPTFLSVSGVLIPLLS
jgi:hypothetical protein